MWSETCQRNLKTVKSTMSKMWCFYLLIKLILWAYVQVTLLGVHKNLCPSQNRLEMCALCDRYPLELLRIMDTPSVSMLWIRYTLWIPVYILSVATEGDLFFFVLFFGKWAINNMQHKSKCWSADRKWIGRIEEMIKISGSMVEQGIGPISSV